MYNKFSIFLLFLLLIFSTKGYTQTADITEGCIGMKVQFNAPSPGNWDFGDSFYFSELSAYVMNQTAPYLVNFIIVPRQNNLSFGSLFEIKSESDQLFINGATTDDIEIISGITSSVIAASGSVASSSNVTSQQTITSKSGSY